MQFYSEYIELRVNSSRENHNSNSSCFCYFGGGGVMIYVTIEFELCCKFYDLCWFKVCVT
jgi:hypothetical protein